MPVIRYSVHNNSHQRQQTVNDVQAWLNSQRNISPFKQKIIQATLNHARQDKFIHINRLSNLLVDRAEFEVIEPILLSVSQSDQQLMSCVFGLLNKITNSASIFKQQMLGLIANDYHALSDASSSLPSREQNIYQFISAESLNKKLTEFQASLAALQHKDAEVITDSTCIGTVCFLGLSYFINTPVALLLLGVAMPYAAQHIKNLHHVAAKEEQTQLDELLKIYKSLTRHGYCDTHKPIVLQILRVIAPYIATEDLCHWMDLSERDSYHKANEEPHPEFLEILAKPPHGIIHTFQQPHETSQNMYDRLELKSLVIETRYSFWSFASSQIKRAVYGVEVTNPAEVALVTELSAPRLN